MSVPKSLALAATLVLGLSTLADAAPRQQYHAHSATTARSCGGGYSCNPQTRDLERLADQYRPGW
jgi:hypothetical protein